MNPKFKYGLIGCISVILLAGMFASGLLVGWAFPAGSGLGIGGLLNPSPTNLKTLFEPFWQTWQVVHNDYVEQPVNDTTLMQGAIRGMLDSLGDPHTAYMNPEQFKYQQQALQGTLEGIGAYIDTTGAYVKIVSLMPGMPAEKAGVKAGDLIIGINGEDMTGVPGDVVHSKVIGPAGTQVTLSLRREGVAEPIVLTITRAKITTPTVESKQLDGNLAYVRINIFGDNTATELRTQLITVLKNNPRGLILDLRGNGGGYLDTAVQVVSEFIKKGVVVYEESGNGTRKPYSALSGGVATDIPLVVLVDEGTASASEITAGAIQDDGRGKLVGTTTYGKGSVQSWMPLVNDQGAIAVTIARWLTPNGRQINKVGIQPDYIVKFTDQDIKDKKDVQLLKAIEVLNDLISGKVN